MNLITTPRTWWPTALTRASRRIHLAPHSIAGSPVAADPLPATPPTWTTPRTGGVPFPSSLPMHGPRDR